MVKPRDPEKRKESRNRGSGKAEGWNIDTQEGGD